MFYHRTGAVDGRAFLIGGNQKRNAAVMIRIAGDKALHRGEHGGKAALHISRAAPAEHALVVDAGLERRKFPVSVWPAGHHVGVPRKRQHRAVVTTNRPKILHIAKR